MFSNLIAGVRRGFNYIYLSKRADKLKVLMPIAVCSNAFLVSTILNVICPTVSTAAWYSIFVTILLVVVIIRYKPKHSDIFGRKIIIACSYCRKMRTGDTTDTHMWLNADVYITTNLDVLVSHGICKECLHKELDKLEDVKDLMDRGIINKGD
jgi:hypothetical protein